MKNENKKKQMKAAVAIFAIVATALFVGTGPTLVADDQSVTNYTGVVTVTLTAEDNVGGSGVRETKYTVGYIDEFGSGVMLAHNETYVDPLQFSAIGVYTIEYWSFDNAGNEELPHKTEQFEIVQIDITPPSTEIEIDGNLSSW